MGTRTRGFANKVTADGVSGLDSTVITGATAETTIAGGDSVLIYDDSASALRKMTRTNFIGGGNTPYFYVYRATSVQTLSNGVQTLAQLNAVLYDSDSGFNTGTYTYTIPSGKSGYYFLKAEIFMGTGTPSSLQFGIIIIKKNGTNVSQNMLDFRSSSLGYDIFPETSIILNCTAGDTLTVDVNCSFTVGTGGVQVGQNLSKFIGYRLIT